MVEDKDAITAVMNRLSQLLVVTEQNSSELKSLNQKVDSLDRSIRGGNNDPGLGTRMALIENCVTSFQMDLDVLKTDFEEFKKLIESRRDRSFWYMITALAGAGITVTTGVVIALLLSNLAK